jgi:hypothetical protein
LFKSTAQKFSELLENFDIPQKIWLFKNSEETGQRMTLHPNLYFVTDVYALTLFSFSGRKL